MKETHGQFLLALIIYEHKRFVVRCSVTIVSIFVTQGRPPMSNSAWTQYLTGSRSQKTSMCANDGDVQRQRFGKIELKII